MSSCVVDREGMVAAEERAFAQGTTAEMLMEDAGRQLAALITQFRPAKGCVLVCAGKGHNGGDALVAGRLLREAGWQVQVRLAAAQEQLSPLTLKKLIEIGHDIQGRSQPQRCDVILDGLLGIGATGPLRGEIREAAKEINHLRDGSEALVVAVDVPSGLDPTTGVPHSECVRADITACIGFTKTWLLTDEATPVVGRLAVLPLQALEAVGAVADTEVIIPDLIRGNVPRRGFDVHKGLFGRVGIIAGSPGYCGAAVLTATAALRSGAGLVTLFAGPEIYQTLAQMCPPEVMVRRTSDCREAMEMDMDVLAIGPGLGAMSGREDELRTVWKEFAAPCVLDADALNALAGHRDDLLSMAATRLLTPHPGEMKRLFPEGNSMTRVESARNFTKRFGNVLLLKGARTVVCEAGAAVAYNSTGGPALAKGGSGDVLTGVCAALIAQGASVRGGAMLAAWICGRAAEHAVLHVTAEHVVASDVIEHLGAAWRDLRKGCY